MSLRGILITALMLSSGIATTASAQRQGQAGQQPPQGRGRGAAAVGAEFAGPPQGPDALPIVEVVGCLSQGTGNTWAVMNATEPVKAPAGFSRAEEVKAAETRPLGVLQFQLIGLAELSPAEHKGHKVVVKGLLIKDGATSRLNVTSLMTASATCK